MMVDTTKPKILLVDDEKPILDSLYRFFRKRKLDAIKANSGEEGLALMNEHNFDIVISDMRMPNMNGAEFLAKAREKTPQTVRILLTGYAEMDAVISAVNEAKIFNYLNKPWDDSILESVVNSALEYRQMEHERLYLADQVSLKNQQLETINASLEEKVQVRTHELSEALDSLKLSSKKLNANFRESLSLLTNVIEMQDSNRVQKTHAIASASIAIAKSLGLPAKNIEQIRIASLLHNIGRLSLPETIRKKPISSLSALELKTLHLSPIQGEVALSGMTGLKTVAKLVRSRHEYLNGQGFPDKLKGDDIPIGSRIICVVSDFWY